MDLVLHPNELSAFRASLLQQGVDEASADHIMECKRWEWLALVDIQWILDHPREFQDNGGRV